MQAKFSEGEDAAKLGAEVETLLNNGWMLEDEQKLLKTYYFKTYTKVMVKSRSGLHGYFR